MREKGGEKRAAADVAPLPPTSVARDSFLRLLESEKASVFWLVAYSSKPLGSGRTFMFILQRSVQAPGNIPGWI